MSSKYKLYGKETEVKDGTRYEVKTLPLQGYVASARKAVCETWTRFKVEKNKFRNSMDKSVQVTNGKVQGALESIGVKDTSLVFQVGAVAIGSLVGLVLARKKSMAHGIAYPALTGGTVWGTIYFSSPENRKKLVESIRNSRYSK